MEHTKRGKCNQPGRCQNWQKKYKTAKQYGLDSKVGLDGNFTSRFALRTSLSDLYESFKIIY